MMKYISFVGILAIASTLLFGTITTAGEPVEIVLEAELANNIQGPMAIGVPADAKAKGGPRA